MDTVNIKARKEDAKLVYTGSRFKSYLQRNKISYKEAADALGIDKNTVGKAVRGGNLNVDIILRICNEYQLKITEFFVLEDENGEKYACDYYISSEDAPVDNVNVSEEKFNYKKCEKIDRQVKAVNDMITHSKSVLLQLSKQYDDCSRILDELVKKIDK